MHTHYALLLYKISKLFINLRNLVCMFLLTSDLMLLQDQSNKLSNIYFRCFIKESDEQIIFIWNAKLKGQDLPKQISVTKSQLAYAKDVEIFLTSAKTP